MAYADADAVTPSSNTRSFTLWSVPVSPGQSFLAEVLIEEVLAEISIPSNPLVDHL